MADGTGTMRLRAQRHGEQVTVKLLIAHPMDTGLARDSAGQIIPAWYIQQVEVWLDERLLLEADWGPAVARNPFLEFAIDGAGAGANLTVRWRDNHGDTRSDQLVLP